MPVVSPGHAMGAATVAAPVPSRPPLISSVEASVVATLFTLSRSLRQGSAEVLRLNGLQAVETANELLDFVVGQLRCAGLESHPAPEIVDLVEFHDHIRRNVIALAQEDYAAAIVSKGMAELADALAGKTRVSKKWNDLRDVARKEVKRRREEDAAKARLKGVTSPRFNQQRQPGQNRGAFNRDAPSDPKYGQLKSLLATDTEVRNKAAPNGCWACISLGKTFQEATKHRMTACPVWREAAAAKGL